MTDIVAKAVRSRMMSGIRSKNTRHEVTIRKTLHAAGFRYRLHRRDLPGTPDITLPRYRAVIFIHGCFWHGHDCHLFKWPSTRPDFWTRKIESNRERDKVAHTRLLEAGWRVCTIWECAMRGRLRLQLKDVTDIIIKWLGSQEEQCVLRGKNGCTSSIS